MVAYYVGRERLAIEVQAVRKISMRSRNLNARKTTSPLLTDCVVIDRGAIEPRQAEARGSSFRCHRGSPHQIRRLWHGSRAFSASARAT